MLIKIKDWKIINKEEYFDYMIGLRDWEYEIKSYRRTRSTEQNRYYRWLLSIIEKETGVSTDEVHEKMRMKFLYVPESWVHLAYTKSTTSLKTDEFSEYIENIKNFMAQFWILLPNTSQYEQNF